MTSDRLTLKKERDRAINLEMDMPANDKAIELIARKSGLFLITTRKIIRIRSPDDLDPELKHNDVPWEQSEILPIGSSNPLVARTVLQTKILSNQIPSQDKKDELSDISWATMESLISLEFIKDRLKTQIDHIIETVSNDLATYTQGKQPKPLPFVEFYDIEFRSFTNEVKRCLNKISELFHILSILEFGTKHESYNNKPFAKGHFQKAYEWAKWELGDQSELTLILNNDLEWIKAWTDIRNTIEHPKANQFVETLNFTLEPDRKVRLPTWRFIHPNYEDMSKPQNLLIILDSIINNMLAFYEELQIILLSAHIECLTPSLVISAEEIPEDKRDPEKPIRFKLR